MNKSKSPGPKGGSSKPSGKPFNGASKSPSRPNAKSPQRPHAKSPAAGGNKDKKPFTGRPHAKSPGKPAQGGAGAGGPKQHQGGQKRKFDGERKQGAGPKPDGSKPKQSKPNGDAASNPANNDRKRKRPPRDNSEKKEGGFKSFKGKGGHSSEPANKKAKQAQPLSRKDRKQLRKERRAAKPHSDVVTNLNSLWSLSISQLDKAARHAAIEDLLNKTKGTLKDVANRHDAARVLQTVLKYSNASQRQRVANELLGSLEPLCMDHHGHHVILKLLEVCTSHVRKAAFTELSQKAGNIKRFASHADAGKVIDFLYASGTHAMKQHILYEFYGGEFALFHSAAAVTSMAKPAESKQGQTTAEQAAADIEEVLATKPEKKDAVLQSVFSFLDKMMEKQLLMFRYTHTLMLQYLHLAPPAQAAAMIARLDAYISQLHLSRHGALVMVHCLSYGTPKDRKNFVKAMKAGVLNLCMHEHSYITVARALDVVDDTVLLNKMITQDIASSDQFLSLLCDQFASRVFLQVLSPNNPSYIAPSDLPIFQPAYAPDPADPSKKVPTSKKAPEQRRAEVLSVLLMPLLQCVNNNMEKLLRDVNGHRVVFEVLRESYLRAQGLGVAAAAKSSDAAEDKDSDAEEPDIEAVAKPKSSKKKGSAAGSEAKADPAAYQLLCTEAFEAIGALISATEPTIRSAAAGAEDHEQKKKNKNKRVKALNSVSTTIDGSQPEAAVMPTEPVEEQWAKENIAQHPYGSLVIKRLLKKLQPNSHEFARIVAENMQEHLALHAQTNRGAFILVELLLHGEPAAAKSISAAFSAPQTVQLIQKNAGSGGSVLVKVLRGEAVDTEEKKETKRAPAAKTKQAPAKTKEAPATPAPSKAPATPAPSKAPATPAPSKVPAAKDDEEEEEPTAEEKPARVTRAKKAPAATPASAMRTRSKK